MKRRKSRKRSIITVTHRVPKWQKDLKAGWKNTKRLAWNLLGVIGLIVVAIYLFRLAMGGG